MSKTVTVIGAWDVVEDAIHELDQCGVNKIYMAGLEVLAPSFLPLRDFCVPIEAPARMQAVRAQVESFATSRVPDGIVWLRRAIRESDEIRVDDLSDLLLRTAQWIAAQEGKTVTVLETAEPVHQISTAA